MKNVALSSLKDKFSKFLRLAEREQVVITRHGRPAGVLIGFQSEDDWFEYRLEIDLRLLRRMASESIRSGGGVRVGNLRLTAE